VASIQKRDNGRWRARYRDSAGREHARHFGRKVDAQPWLDKVTAAVVTDTYVDPRAGGITFGAFFAEWAARQVWTEGSRLSAQQAASSVTFARVPMRDLRPSHLQGWVKAMSLPAPSRRQGLAPSTVRTRFNWVHIALRGAVADRVIPTDPSAGLRLPRVRKQAAAMTIPTPAEVGRATAAAAGHFQAFVEVCAFAGLRLGEAAGLQVADVDFLRRTVTVARQVQGQTNSTLTVVAPKYGSERVIPVSDELLLSLGRHLERFGAWGADRWVFGDGVHLFQRNSAGNQWRNARAAADLPEPLTLHDLRHFYASGLISTGCDVVTVQRALGHSSPSITLNVYAHLWPKAEDRTRAASAELWREVHADHLRTEEAQ